MKTVVENFLGTTISSIFNFLKNIPLDNIMPNNGIICIYVVVTILGIVVLAKSALEIWQDMRIARLLNSEDNQGKQPINLVYIMVNFTKNPVPFIIDKNDPTGVIMHKSIFRDRGAMSQMNGVWGFSYSNIYIDKNSGVLTTKALISDLNRLEVENRGVQSKGLPIERRSDYTRFTCKVSILKDD